MQLYEFPTELLFHVARCLDTKSLIALARTHPRLASVPLELLSERTVDGPTGDDLEYLRRQEKFVRSLNLCGLYFGPDLNNGTLSSYVADFHHLRELNLVNSGASYQELLRSLPLLSELETLSFSMLESARDDRNKNLGGSGPFSSIKKLYIEAGTPLWSGKVIMDFLNRCESIEFVHINFIEFIDNGRVSVDRLDPYYVPALGYERWTTLHTVICSQWLSCRSAVMETFLSKLFLHNSSRERARWIGEAKDTYIYERRHLNHNATWLPLSPRQALERSKTVDILPRYQVVTPSQIDDGHLRLLWGLPSSLRIRGVEDWSSGPTRMCFLEALSSQLRELDLTACHGGYTKEFRLAVITSTPNLRVLALPICFFSSSNGVCRGTRSRKRARSDAFVQLTEALHQLKLEKLFLEGGPSHGAAMQACADCCNKLRAVNFIQLSGLSHLRELNLRNIRDMDSSAYDHLWNQNLHTLRLHALTSGIFPGLRNFVQRCPELRNLKLSSPQLLRTAGRIIVILVKAANLRQLCLDPWDSDPVPAARVLAMLAELPPSIELVHVHLPRRVPGHEDIVRSLSQKVEDLEAARGKRIISDFSSPTQGQAYMGYIRSTRGRGFCSFINSIGYVPAVGWEVD